MFPSLNCESHLYEILKLCQPSLVYHADHARPRLPPIHTHICSEMNVAVGNVIDFPSTDPLTAWKLRWFGNAALNYPPLKSISTVDLSTKKKARTFSEWSVFTKYLTKSIENETGQSIPLES
ncbi:Hypothetical protein PHPALM_6151 [Phytophthora palmivora]|uniref:Uncharacterized protein n=1 Tax=Phytophthora palmivora TaxID=4796 RepID=A0A2P4YFJ0_9STRA|nr:Hypothetical protein PHPALM_6151 [Phytophthora palmivora]